MPLRSGGVALFLAALIGTVTPGCAGPELSQGPGAERPDDAALAMQPTQTCTTGATQTRSCGLCRSGTRQRTCSGGVWGQWSVCTGVERRFPFDAATRATVCPPYDHPVVFFSPHQDDESLGMSGSIAMEVAAGHQVFLELMTGGQESAARTTLADGRRHGLHPGRHTYSLSVEEFSQARTDEFLDAAARQHVTGVFLNGFGENHLTTGQVAGRVKFWQRWGGDRLSVHGTAGAQDPREVGAGPHPDHAAVWTALTTSSLSNVVGHLIYHYRTNAGSYDEQVGFDAFCLARREALNAYKVWDPSIGRYAVGYHSVRTLFDSSAVKCVEYLVHWQGSATASR